MIRSPFYIAMGTRIALLRKANGLGQKELAEKLYTTTKVVSDIEIGRRYLNAHEVDQLCNLFAVTASQLLGRTE